MTSQTEEKHTEKATAKSQLTGYPSLDRPWLKYYTAEIQNAPLPECTIYEYMYENNKDYPQDIALNYMGRKITYREFFENIDQTARALSAIGVKPEEIVTVALPSIPEALYVVYALNRIGAGANMIHPLAGKDERINYLNEVQSRIAVIFDGAYETIASDIHRTSVEKVIVASPGDSLPRALKFAYAVKNGKCKPAGDVFQTWNDFIKAGNGTELKAVKKDCRKMAIISHTGGTTGEPKGVMCSDVSCNSLMWQLLCNFEFQRQEISMAVLPPFVNYSLVESMMAMLAEGFEVVLIPNYKPENFAKYIKKYHPNEILSIPAYWEAILKIPNIERIDMSCMKHLHYGGEGMRAETEIAINTLLASCGAHTELCKEFGATEMVAGATVSYINCNAPGSVGIPMVKTNCKIVEPGSLDELSYGQEGEICFSGPTLMNGYYNNIEATDEGVKVHADGHRWLHTGDIGYITEDGVIYVTGRIKRIIMTKGKDQQVTKLFPDRIEKAVNAHPAVSLCCVIGVPDEERIHYAKAVVELNEGVAPSEQLKQDIQAFCRDKLPDYQIPEVIEFCTELPRTPRGKVDYRELEQQTNAET